MRGEPTMSVNHMLPYLDQVRRKPVYYTLIPHENMTTHIIIIICYKNDIVIIFFSYKI